MTFISSICSVKLAIRFSVVSLGESLIFKVDFVQLCFFFFFFFFFFEVGNHYDHAVVRYICMYFAICYLLLECQIFPL